MPNERLKPGGELRFALIGGAVVIGSVAIAVAVLLLERDRDAARPPLVENKVPGPAEVGPPLPLAEPATSADEVPDDSPPEPETAAELVEPDPQLPDNVEVLPDVPFALEFSPLTVGGPPKIHYRWNKAKDYHCYFRLTMETEKVRHGISGLAAYAPQNSSTSKLETVEEGLAGGGTAFVISRQGYLATCAHVVEGATTVRAHLNGRSILARVILYDPRNDLAVLKVPEQDLTALPLADAEDIRPDIDVRAMGYPLRDFLGSSLKVSRGKIVKIDRNRPQTELQIDADINPGNSGGPVVDDYGRVVGVASTVEIDDNTANVGFAVSTNTLIDLLAIQGIPYETNSNSLPLSGPQLVKQVEPSLVILDIETGPGGVGTSPTLARRISNGYDIETRHLDQFPQQDAPEFRWYITGEIMVDQSGEIHQRQGEFFLPYLSVYGGKVGLDTLPAYNVDQWHTKGSTSIAYLPLDADLRKGIQGNDWLGEYWNIARHRVVPFPGQKEFNFRSMPGVALPAIQFALFTIVDSDQQSVTVHKQVAAVAEEEVDGKPLAELTTDSEIRYAKDRMASGTHWAGILTLRDGPDEVELSMHATIGSREKDDPIRWGPSSPWEPRVPLTAAELKSIDGYLAAKHPTTKMLGLVKLAQIWPHDSQRAEVVKRIEPLVASQNAHVRRLAVRALARWCDVRQIDLLADLMVDSDLSVASIAAEQLCSFKEDVAVAVVADLLDQDTKEETLPTIVALRSAGKSSERIFIELLGHHKVRWYALLYLGQWGGPRAASELSQRIRKGHFQPQEKETFVKIFHQIAPPRSGYLLTGANEFDLRLGTDTLDDVLDQVKSPSSSDQLFRNLARLSNIGLSDRRRPQVAEAIDRHLKSELDEIRNTAYLLLHHLKDDASTNIPSLIEATSHRNHFVRWAAIDGLRLFDDLKAAQAIARRLAEPLDQRAARKALRRMLAASTKADVRSFIQDTLP